MKPDHALAFEYLHIPSCLIKFYPQSPSPKLPSSSSSVQKQKANSNNNSPTNEHSSEEFSSHQQQHETCEQKAQRKMDHHLGIRRISNAKELGLNEDSVTFLDEEDEGGANMIVCSNGNCKFLNTHFVLGMSDKHWSHSTQEVNGDEDSKSSSENLGEANKGSCDKNKSTNKKKVVLYARMGSVVGYLIFLLAFIILYISITSMHRVLLPLF